MNPTHRATLLAMEGLAEAASRLQGAEREAILAIVSRRAPWEDEAPSSLAAAEAMKGLLPFIGALGDDGSLPKEARAGYLADFARLAIDSVHLPADKLCRWLGFVAGVLEARGALTLPAAADGLPGFSVRGLDRLSCALGYVQGILVARGLLDVRAERDRTRPIFHAAYDAGGIPRPGSVEVGSR